MTRIDPHSYFDTTQPPTSHLDLEWFIDFMEHRIEGSVTLVLQNPSGGIMDLDTKGLTIRAVYSNHRNPIPFQVGDEEPILGQRLRLDLPDGTHSIMISYVTSPEAVALQWFDPEMTLGKKQPFMYSQCQAIHARTIVPCQDTPRVRVTYRAVVTVPEEITPVMSAGPAGQIRDLPPGLRAYRFVMPQPIPPYLLAVAAGDLDCRDLSPRARVWAEPKMVEKAGYEFGEVEQMIVTAEKMFGPYEWDRYDMLVLPPAFPFGGMENPRMTFLTPTVIAGDRSLVDVIAHELAHSWTGNLVTNATMDHFWLNEGFTTWAERRILDALHGEKASALRWAIGQKALDESVERFGVDSPLTKLRTDLQGIDPDDAFSSIPYEKGSRFVCVLERHVGRERFNQFMKKYIASFRFTSITTEEFIDFLEQELPGTADAVQANSWLYETGMPSNAPVFQSERLDELTTIAAAFAKGTRPLPEQTSTWNPDELLVFLQRLPRELDTSSLAWMDQTFQLTQRGNYEILVEWLAIAAGSEYQPVLNRVQEVLLEVGRMKYLRPLYAALGRHASTRALAKEIYAKGKAGYHSLSRRVVESTMGKYDGGNQ
jgi:leukotriene-A4 hydrolase